MTKNIVEENISVEEVDGHVVICVCLPLNEKNYSEIKKLIAQYKAETFELIFDLRAIKAIPDLDGLIRNTDLGHLDQVIIAVSAENLIHYLSGRAKKATALLSNEFEQKLQELKSKAMEKILTPKKELVAVAVD